MAHPGVEAVYPLYLETRVARLKKIGENEHPIRVIGVDHTAELLGLDADHQLTNALRRPQTGAIDRKSKRKKFPFNVKNLDELQRTPAELAGRPIQLVGVFTMGTDFATEGSLLMSEENFASYFPARVPGGDPLSVVDVGLVQVSSEMRVDRVAKSLDDSLPDDVSVVTRQRFRQQEIDFWDKSTPVGIIFSTGTALGFVVGMIICYQIIYTDIADHMPEFATLKAMGYPDAFFVRLIVAEAVYLSLLGFIPGALLSWAVYEFLGEATGLMLNMTPWTRVASVLALTVAMCVASGLFAVRKLAAADPADLF
jgi:putative ABC transport system permease protein